jgi:hypothetical protein
LGLFGATHLVQRCLFSVMYLSVAIRWPSHLPTGDPDDPIFSE